LKENGLFNELVLIKDNKISINPMFKEKNEAIKFIDVYENTHKRPIKNSEEESKEFIDRERAILYIFLTNLLVWIQ